MGMRYVQACLLFMVFVAIYISRVNVGLAVVAMTHAETTNPDFPEFNWSEKEISYILSSFYWGFSLTQLPGGILCKHYGAKLVMGLSVFVSGLLSALTPWSVNWGGWQAFCVIRILLGLSQGLATPCIFEHLAKWSPLKERNRLGAFSHTGYDCGMVLAMGLSGIIAEGSMGWPGISYVSAGICFVWCLLWLIFGANNPSESKFITEKEKLYIESSMGRHEGDFHRKKIPIPWKAIFTSVPFIALLIVRSSEMWGLSTLEAQIPSYLHGVLNMEIKSNALFSALPFLASWIMSYVFLLLADILQHKHILSLTALRRVFNSVAYWIPAVGFIAIGFLDEDNKAAALTLMIASTAINTGEIIGSSLNPIDLAPTHAGLLFSIINTVASVVALVSPLAVGVIVTDANNRSQWQIVFAIAAVVFLVGNLLYIIFGTAETQPWNDEHFSFSKEMETMLDDHKNNIKHSKEYIKALDAREEHVNKC